METYMQIFSDTEEQLGRELADQEIHFLQWVYERYANEKQAEKI